MKEILDALRAAGLNPVVIDENMDFSKLPTLNTPPKGFQAEVIADSSGTWATNSLVFATHDEAEVYGRNLARRWYLVTDVRVVEVDKPANYRFIDGKLAPTEQP